MDYTMRVKFELEDVDGKHNAEFVVDDAESWHELVILYTNFLSSRYGYHITDNILFITDYPWGQVKGQYITSNEYAALERNRQREHEQESLWGDDE